MPFDFETKATARLRAQTSMRIGIVGFGTFGQFLAKRLVQQGHKVRLTSLKCRLSHGALNRNIAIDVLSRAKDMRSLFVSSQHEVL